jgi:hypothetical protein
MTPTIITRRTAGFLAIKNEDLMNNPESPTLKVSSKFNPANYITSRNLVKVSLHNVILQKVCGNPKVLKKALLVSLNVATV